MRYGPKTLQYYLILFARRHGITDPDVFVEISELCCDFDGIFDTHLQRIEQLEAAVRELHTQLAARK